MAASNTSGRTEVAVSCNADHCETKLPQFATVEGFCSEWCRHIHNGSKLLNLIKYDHRFCFGCMRQLKEIERPPEELDDFIIGFQYTTEHATHGQKTLSEHRYKDNVGTGTICEGCGTTDHRDDFYESENVQERAKRLFDILNLTRQEGQHNKHVSVERFIEAWNDSKHWSYALGKALYE